MFEQHTVTTPEGARVRLQWHVGHDAFRRIAEQVPVANPHTYFNDGERESGFADEWTDNIDFMAFDGVVNGYPVRVFTVRSQPNDVARVEVVASEETAA